MIKSLLYFFLLGPAMVLNVFALTLEETFQKGKAHMETLPRASARLSQAQEKNNQAVGGVLPRLTARGNYQEIDPPKAAGGAPRGLVRTNQYSALINLSQPLFRGTKEYSAIRQGQALIHSEKLLVESASIQVYREAINSFFNTLLAQKDLLALNELKKATEERAKVLKERARIGRSRKGEVALAEAQAMNVEALVIDGNRALAMAVEQLEFFTGQKFSPNDISLKLQQKSELKDVNFYLESSKQRPDIKAQSYQQEVAQETVTQSKGSHLPTLDFNANYYLTRTGILETSKWDVALSVSVPLFEGGTTQSQVREAVEKKRDLVLQQQRELRELELKIKQLHQAVTQGLAQKEELKKAVQKMEENYRENLRDYNLGLVTNLEVLQSLNTFIETKRSLARVEVNQELNLKNLECEAGILPWDSQKSL